MSYLRDKLEKRKKIYRWGILAVLALILIFLRAPISHALARAAQIIFRPILSAGSGVGESAQSFGALFRSKKTLWAENEDLKMKIGDLEARLFNYNALQDENNKLKEILNRSGGKKLVLGAILAKPNRSLYDTVLIDAGANDALAEGDLVLAYGDIPVGRIAEVYPDTAKVSLFSSPGERTEVLVSGRDIFMMLVGRGGGNFEMTLPRELALEPGTEVVLPGYQPRALAKIETILSDPRDPDQKALLTSPVNIQELKFVEVEI